MNPQEAFSFLLGVFFNLAIILAMTRFLLQLVGADFYNPVSQFVVRATNPVLGPLRKLIPPGRQFDGASLVAVLVLIVAQVYVEFLLRHGGTPPGQILLLWSFNSLGSWVLGYFFVAVIIRVVLSWIMQDPRHPFFMIVNQITEPLMAPARRVLPPMGGLDLSPILVLIALQFLMVLFFAGPR